MADAPTLDDLVREPTQAARLSPEERATLLAQACALIVTLASSNGSTATAPPSPAPEHAVRVAEAATILAMSEDYVYRQWRTLGGYRDADGHVKFAASDLRKHIERARRR